MIICHEKRVIFIKTKKTGGTSFEIALSKFCGDRCIITPITPQDELLRRTLGFRSAQNFSDYRWVEEGTETRGTFFNHIPAAVVKKVIPSRIWDDYRKITIVRDPFDVAISRYFWEGGERTGLTFHEYLKRFPKHLTENAAIAPLSGECQLDFYLRYEDLKPGFVRSGLDFMWETFTGIRAKGDKRPRAGTSVNEMYNKYPDAIDIVASICRAEIETLGYDLPRRG